MSHETPGAPSFEDQRLSPGLFGTPCEADCQQLQAALEKEEERKSEAWLHCSDEIRQFSQAQNKAERRASCASSLAGARVIHESCPTHLVLFCRYGQ